MAGLFGIDISKWQKGFNIQSALNEGFTYVILRAGYTSDSGYFKDPVFESFYTQAKQLKVEQLGAYYFGQAFSVNDAIKEANLFLSYLSGKSIKKVYYDVEAKMLNQSQQSLTSIIKAFCDTVNAAGYICGIYSSEHYFNNGMFDVQLKGYPHWVAKYSTKSPVLKSGAVVEMWQYGGTTNYIRDARIAGTVVDQNLIYVPWDNAQPAANVPKPVTIPVNSNDTSYDNIHKLALEVLQGKYGSGVRRKELLGDLYEAVQAEVNAILEQRASQFVEKTTEQLANEVLAGLWGSGMTRKLKLGKRYDEVQAMVNKLVNERNTNGFRYTVVKGDTLTKIAKKYNVTVQKLMELNGIEDPNKIWVGQMLKIS